MGPTMRAGSMGPTMRAGSMGPTMRAGRMVTAPMVSGRVQRFNNNFAFNKGFRDHRDFHDHRHHHRFHNRNFFAFGFAGPYFDGYYDCWRLVQTYYGLRRVYVCGDYSY